MYDLTTLKPGLRLVKPFDLVVSKVTQLEILRIIKHITGDHVVELLMDFLHFGRT